MSTIDVRRLAHATLWTTDIDRQVDYYTEVVGLQLIERDKTSAFLATREGLETICLEKGDKPELARLAFQVAPGSDLKELSARLGKAGIESERRSGISPGVEDAIVFPDAKGTPIEIFAEYKFARREKKEQRGIMPFKLGHVAYRCHDVKKVAKFYEDHLGFLTSDWRGDFFVFQRCGVDHHTVNFVVDEEQKLHHIAFEVKDWGEIHRAAEHLARHDIRLVWGPGRHIIGHNIAIYHRNWDEVRVEFFCEMDQMKDEALGYFDPRPWHQDTPQRPKTWGKETLRNYWGFGSERTYPGYP
jgi:catechol 2,3-dioxygenase-like lactoylglutathione lyase family enzyme